MTEMESAWGKVADHMSGLLLKLKLHAQEEMSEADLKAKVGFDKVRTAIDEAMTAIGDAASDKAVHEDAKATGRAFVDALDATFKAVQDRLKSAS